MLVNLKAASFKHTQSKPGQLLRYCHKHRLMFWNFKFLINQHVTQRNNLSGNLLLLMGQNRVTVNTVVYLEDTITSCSYCLFVSNTKTTYVVYTICTSLDIV